MSSLIPHINGKFRAPYVALRLDFRGAQRQ